MTKFKLAQVIKEEVKKQLSESMHKIIDMMPAEGNETEMEIAFDNDPNDAGKSEPDTWRALPLQDFQEWLDGADWANKDIKTKYALLQQYFDTKIKDINKLKISQGA